MRRARKTCRQPVRPPRRQAAPGWVSTQTHAPEVFSATGEPLAEAEALAPGTALHTVVSLRLRNAGLLDQRIARLHAGDSQALLSEAQASALHLPTQAQVQAVVQHLSQNGFRNIGVADTRMLVSAEGSAAMAAAAFNTRPHNFGTGTERRFANTSDAQVPVALQDTVLAVHGLHLRRQHGAQTLSDFAAFLARAGYTAFTPTVTIVGTPGTDTSGTPEWDLDSQNAISAAGGKLKQMIFYTATQGRRPADAGLQPGGGRAQGDGGEHLAGRVRDRRQEQQHHGQQRPDLCAGRGAGPDLLGLHGDSGSLECGKRRGNKQSYPAVSPYVVALGGTTLATNGSAYAGETVWSGAGGGPSTTEPAKSWQTASGVLGTSTSRGVPDISLNADPASGSIIIVKGKNAQYGGTSLAAPLLAGFWARIQSADGSTRVSPNPAFYQYGNAHPTLFHDVTSGNNGGYTAAAPWDCASGRASLDVGALAGFINGSTGW